MTSKFPCCFGHWDCAIDKEYGACARDDRCPDCKDYIDELEAENVRLENEIERLQLCRIAAENPGIDIEKVKENRARLKAEASR